MLTFAVLCNRRKEIAKLLEETREHLYQANHTWLTSIRRHLRRSLVDGAIEASAKSKPFSFLSHPVPECSCSRSNITETSAHTSRPSSHTQVDAVLGVTHHCPRWMDGETISRSKDKETEEVLDEDVSSFGLFFKNGVGSHESGGGEINKEENQLEDQEELEGVE